MIKYDKEQVLLILNIKNVILSNHITCFGLMKVETDIVEWEVIDGIIISRYKDGVEIGLKDVQEMVEKRLATQEHTMPIFNDSRAVKSIDKEARDFLANEGSEKLSAVAVLIQSPVGRVVFNFYIHFSKPKVPTKFFLSKEEALAWLEQFKLNEEAGH